MGGRVLYVACKRPFSTPGARRLYRHALGQIATALEGAPEGARGVVALSIARFVDPDYGVFVHDTEASGRAQLSEMLLSAARDLMSRPRRWPAPSAGTIGLLWHVNTPGFNRSHKLLMAVQQLNVVATSPEGSADDMLLQALYSRLHAMFES